MGSKLTRQRSLDFDSKLSKRRRQRNDTPGEGERSGGRGGGDFLFTSLMLKSDKLPGMLRKTNHSPYVRRVAWIREIQRLLREQKMEQAAEVLKLLRKVRGMSSFWDEFVGSALYSVVRERNAVLFAAVSRFRSWILGQKVIFNAWDKRKYFLSICLIGLYTYVIADTWAYNTTVYTVMMS